MPFLDRRVTIIEYLRDDQGARTGEVLRTEVWASVRDGGTSIQWIGLARRSRQKQFTIRHRTIPALVTDSPITLDFAVEDEYGDAFQVIEVTESDARDRFLTLRAEFTS